MQIIAANAFSPPTPYHRGPARRWFCDRGMHARGEAPGAGNVPWRWIGRDRRSGHERSHSSRSRESRRLVASAAEPIVSFRSRDFERTRLTTGESDANPRSAVHRAPKITPYPSITSRATAGAGTRPARLTPNR